ncbi:OpgC domain-containing protein [uncultured Hyphomicrobium sp.]|uniref:OpgC family protein n=1 Tax=uncultured Hyphomicrobium sp. TaxID=194373 RepID=UPI0025D75D99|nr:OpgC domain-containing protein [uncultured Hyphomicrobium sp.]
MQTNALKRDLRIDLLRGLALVFIYIDHIPFDRLSHLTLRNFGYTNAADVFVLLAGTSFALAYARRLDVSGLKAVLGPVLRRIFTIYFAHILVLLLGLIVLVQAGRDAPLDLFSTISGPVWAGLSPRDAIAMATTLEYQPPYFDILPLYVALLLMAIPILLLARVHWALALAASIALWAFAEFYGLNFSSTRSDAGWYFNPLSWQFVFTVGICLGLASQRPAPILEVPWLPLVCVLYLCVAFFMSAPWRRYGVPIDYCNIETLPLLNSSVDRQTPWRFANTLAWVFLIARYVPRDAGWLTHPVTQLATRMGRHSLAVFCVGSLLSLVARVFFACTHDSWLVEIALDVGGTGLLALTAYMLDHEPRHAPDTA